MTNNGMLGAVLGLVMLVWWQVTSSHKRLELRLDLQRQQLDAIAAHLGIKPRSDIPPEILGLLQAGRKIEAIKVYRESTGVGLKEAKDAVERMQAGMGPTIIQP